jgi:hypothetical protein
MKNSEVKEVVKVSVEELTQILLSLDKNQFVSIEYQIPLKMNKGRGQNKNPYYNKVMKTTRINILPVSDYEKRVNNNLEKQGEERNFESQGQEWSEKVSHFVSKHKTKTDENGQPIYYFRYESFHKPISSVLKYNGLTVQKSVFTQWLPKPKKDNGFKPNFQNITISNLKKLHTNGVVYEVE